MHPIKLYPKHFLSAFCVFSGASTALAKDCDSELNANLKPLNTNVKANAEFFVGAYHSNFKTETQTTYTPMLNFASEIATGESSSFFMNGSIKYKVESTTETAEAAEDTSSEGTKGAQVGDWRIGLRDAYYQSKGTAVDYKLGFMTYTLGDQLLLDDRALGFDTHIKSSSFTARVFGAGVLDPFSREKQSCISKNSFAPESEEEEAEESAEAHTKGKGRNFAMTKHFAGVRLEFGGMHHHENKAAAAPSDDEFEATTLSSANTQAATYGLLYFVESKNDFADFKHFPGLFGSASLASIDFATEAALQISENASTLGYIGKAYRSFVFGNGQTFKLFSGYTAHNFVSGSEHFAPSYSNMFLGEAAQYLTKDNNVVFAGVAYRPTNSLSLDLGSYHKATSAHSAELDVSSTYYYYERSKLKIGANWLYGPAYAKDLVQAYAEIRHIF